jgi:murein DD-endopeptidase MepM/ murein hydrolase activator NlpD
VAARFFAFAALFGAALPSAHCGVRGPKILSSYRSRMGANRLQRLADHAGIDFGASRGTPVLAAADGEVVHVGVDPLGCGIGVLIAHWDFNRFTVYCHMEKVFVTEGRAVRRGDTIGRIGTTGDAVEIPHVHLELCTGKCERGHMDGYLRGTEDPFRYITGCYEAGKEYPKDRLVLTHPVACGD